MFDQTRPAVTLEVGSTSYDHDVVPNVHAAAAAVRERLPGVPDTKLHKLLYYAQGHHLAAFGQPLFAESVSAWDMGRVVGKLWYAEENDVDVETTAALDQARLNTIGYVLHRYGGMTGSDLGRLSHDEAPWRDANVSRRPGHSVKIPNDRIRAYFVSLDSQDDPWSTPVEQEVLDALLEDAERRRRQDLRVDSLGDLSSRLANLDR